MIVVAIIGILAAVAIPGFMAYIKNSKTTEAKTDLNSIQKGAISYFEAEHYDSTGMTATSKQYPSSQIEVKKLGVEPSETTVGVKQSPIAAATKAQMSGIPWSTLNFKINNPFYYSYAYIADGQETEEYDTGAKDDAGNAIMGTRIKTNGGFKKSHFEVSACASLSSAKDSVFYLRGYSDGTTSPVIEGDSSNCYTATVPSDPT